MPEQEQAQLQDFRNWVQSDPDSATRSAPESPIIGLIESSDAAACQEVGTSSASKEDAPRAEKSAPSAEQAPPFATTSDAATAAAASSGGEAGGSSKS